MTGKPFFDGAMGTQLGAVGLEMGRQNNVSHLKQCQGYICFTPTAEVDMLITNTLTMNRIQHRVSQHRGGRSRGQSGRRQAGQGRGR